MSNPIGPDNENTDALNKAHAAAANALHVKIGSIAERAVYYMAPGHDLNSIDRCQDGRHMDPKGCNIRKNLAIKFLDRLSASEIWQPANPLKAMPFTYMLHSFLKLSVPEYDPATVCTHPYCAAVSLGFLDIMGRRLVELKDEAKEIDAGLCLDCFKVQNARAGKCRIKH